MTDYKYWENFDEEKAINQIDDVSAFSYVEEKVKYILSKQNQIHSLFSNDIREKMKILKTKVMLLI